MPAIFFVIPAIFFVIPEIFFVIPEIFFVIPAIFFVIPAIFFVIPAKAGIYGTAKQPHHHANSAAAEPRCARMKNPASAG